MIHLLKAVPPWREGEGITECGTKGEAVPWENGTRWAKHIPNPADLCDGCRDAVSYWHQGFHATWQADPGSVIQRCSNQTWMGLDLEAITKLVELHRDEWEVIRWSIDRRSQAN